MPGGIALLGIILAVPSLIDFIGERIGRNNIRSMTDYKEKLRVGNRRTEPVCTTLYQSYEEREGFEPRGAEAPYGNAAPIPKDDSVRI